MCRCDDAHPFCDGHPCVPVFLLLAAAISLRLAVEQQTNATVLISGVLNAIALMPLKCQVILF